MPANDGSKAKFTVPGLELKDGQRVGKALQMRLHALNDLQLTLKHAHWNVVGPNFIGVHEMLDPQVASIRLMVDALAERMATLGVAPNGLAGALVKQRGWDDYSINRASTGEHLAALDLVFSGVIGSMRECIAEVGALDPVTEDLLIGQTGELEQFQWFIRSHLENDHGELLNAGAKTEKDAAAKAM